MSKLAVLLALLLVVCLCADPVPPSPKQYYLVSKSISGTVVKNWVDKVNDLYRLDLVSSTGIMLSQDFYFGSQKTGYHIAYKLGILCTTEDVNNADTLAAWQTKAKYIGVGTSISVPHQPCNMWNNTIGVKPSYIFSYLASTKDNTPVELLENNQLLYQYSNFTTGPDSLPKNIFTMPIDKSRCL